MGRRGGSALRRRWRRWLDRVSADADRDLRARMEARKEEVRAQVYAPPKPRDWNRYYTPD